MHGFGTAQGLSYSKNLIAMYTIKYDTILLIINNINKVVYKPRKNLKTKKEEQYIKLNKKLKQMCKVQTGRLNYHNMIKVLKNVSHSAEEIRRKRNTKRTLSSPAIPYSPNGHVKKHIKMCYRNYNEQ